MSASYYLTTRYNNWVSRTMELACGMQVQLEGNLRQGGGEGLASSVHSRDGGYKGCSLLRTKNMG